jgi:hypothetical protein
VHAYVHTCLQAGPATVVLVAPHVRTRVPYPSVRRWIKAERCRRSGSRQENWDADAWIWSNYPNCSAAFEALVVHASPSDVGADP